MLLWATMLALPALGCDRGTAAFQEISAPDVSLIATHPVDGAGFECDGTSDECGVPRNTKIELRFDRFLLPEAVSRQGVRVFTGSADDALFLTPTYDVVERVISYQPVNPLEPGVVYTVEVVAPNDADSSGLRAFDGAPLGEAGLPLRFGFRTRREAPPDEPAAPAPPTCDEIAAILTAACGSVGCHSTTDLPESDCGPGRANDGDGCVGVPRMGLRLDSVDGIEQTLLGKVARQTETGSRVGQPLASPGRFGTQMPLIDPGNPSSSYVMYKLLTNELVSETEDPCESDHSVASSAPDEPPVCRPARGENDRLREWFVRLDPMPRSRPRLSRSVLRRLERWISALDSPDPRARCSAPTAP